MGRFGEKRGSIYYYPKSQLHKGDPKMDELTNNGEVISRLIRVVGGRKESGGWSKHLDDVFGLDGLTAGFPHFARDNAVEIINELAKNIPEFALNHRERALSLRWLNSHHSRSHNEGLFRYTWVREELYKHLATPVGARVQLKLWEESILESGIRIWKEKGWTSSRGLAICVRWRNSGSTSSLRRLRRTGDEKIDVEYAIDSYKKGRSSGPARRKLIRDAFPQFEQVNKEVTIQDLNYDGLK